MNASVLKAPSQKIKLTSIDAPYPCVLVNPGPQWSRSPGMGDVTFKMNLRYFEAFKAIFYKTVNKGDLISHNQDFLAATISGSFHRAQTIVYRAWDGKHVLLSLQNSNHVAILELNINFLRFWELSHLIYGRQLLSSVMITFIELY